MKFLKYEHNSCTYCTHKSNNNKNKNQSPPQRKYLWNTTKNNKHDINLVPNNLFQNATHLYFNTIQLLFLFTFAIRLVTYTKI